VQQFFLAGKYPAQEDLGAVYRLLCSTPPEGESEWTLARLVDASDVPRAKVQVALSLLRHQHVLRQDRDGALVMLKPSLDEAALESLSRAYRDKRTADKALLEQMVFYGQTGYCRWRVILMHFGESENFIRCGSCDNCERMKVEDERRARAPAVKADPLRKPNPEPLRTARFAEGAHVRVRKYGVGIVEEADGRTVTVKFPNGSSRCFLAGFVEALRSRRLATAGG
jgi:ATP-dependent DNA helicase RecQ